MVVAGGLVMHGTPIPIEVAAGYSPFDATRQLLEEQDLPMAQQSTGTLLLQLRSHAAEPPGMRAHGDDHFYALWSELAQRGLPVEGVLRAEIAPAIAQAVLRVLPSFQFGRSQIERQSPAPTLRRDLTCDGGPVPVSGQPDATRPGENTPRIRTSTGAVSHTEPSDRNPTVGSQER